MAMPAQMMGSSKAIAAALRGVSPAPSPPQLRGPAADAPTPLALRQGSAGPPEAAIADLSSSFFTVSDSDAKRWHQRSLLEVAGGRVVAGSDESGRDAHS